MASSARQLVLGSGNVSNVDVGSPAGDIVTFSQAQNFREGATVYYLSGAYTTRWTVRGGRGTVWQMYQNYYYNYGTAQFYTSDPGISRARGGTGNTMGRIIPGAKHFVYMAPVDQAGNPDWYWYLDTLFPEKGVHPYTRDRWTGLARIAQPQGPYPNVQTDGVLIGDAATRLKDLDTLLPILLK
ncbi:MAG TPA: hypothetical protein VJU81_22985 [Methylomirabilota bacterium]|nr:hypothetical protein [Methylomirabilota bacterium]